MLTKTTITAIRALMYIGSEPNHEPLSIRRVAERLGESPTYLAKVARHLVKTGILKAHCGVAGGIVLNRPPKQITLRSIVEACQGTILADFCQETRTLEGTCAFHAAAAELHRAIVGVLSRWTLEKFIERPGPSGHLQRSVLCLVCPRSAETAGPSRVKSSRRRPAVQETPGGPHLRRVKR
ncbi:MAG: Rrf2 family transcriptional regulator [Planctomycetes bacterium]|nr:Rrf2 family transcriptional regulator [Planctomycetota bacterium]